MKRLATLALGLGLIVTTSLSAASEPYRGPTDAPVHDRYAATVHCGLAVVTSVMRDDHDAIDGVMTRLDDLFPLWGEVCPNVVIEVTYIP